MNSSKCSPNLHGKYCDSQALQLIKIVRSKKDFNFKLKIKMIQLLSENKDDLATVWSENKDDLAIV